MKPNSPLAITALAGLTLLAGSAFAQTWTQTSAPITNWTSIACSADGTKVVATAIGGFPGDIGPVYMSTNSGATWTQTSAPITNWQSVASSADGTKLAAASYFNVSISSDSGATWTTISGVSGRRVASSADGMQLFLSGGLLSSNSGATWTRIPASGWVIASSADGTKLASAYFNNNGFPMGDISVSTNSGATWTSTSAPITGWTALACSANGSLLVVTPGHTSFPTPPGRVYVLRNWGGTWTESASPVLDWSSIACSADGTKLVAAISFRGGVYTSLDSGVTWISNGVPVTDWSAVACSADGSKMFAAVAEYPGGGIWTSQSTPVPELSIKQSDTNLVLSWLVPSLPFVLQENSDLTTTNWTDVPGTPALNFTNLQNQLTLPMPAGNRFYRLKH